MTVLHERATLATLTGWHIALELTGRCQLACTHCYAESGPAASHGTMTGDDWCHLISEAAVLGARVQYIGGEPTLHPQFERILTHTTELGVPVEVFTNLYRIRESWWELLSRSGVSLATSYYSDKPGEHAQITGRADGYARTRTNIVRAVGLGIPVRASIVQVLPGQRVEQARGELEALGVTGIRLDELRGIGRGRLGGQADPSQLCGRCGDHRVAVSPTGHVTPCVMARWMVAGDVQAEPLSRIVAGSTWREWLVQVPARARVCAPECAPSADSNDCAPADQVDGE
ncbi:radical SAM protein [Acrocarpospora catenulata]|uniref:radical SAM protein n=1 Tax=Acrocarpospora catenulata TaxID=2836182 RepID=UPI001BDB1810|nr:radical SAM protein [Acrocarpospora catenulata]